MAAGVVHIPWYATGFRGEDLAGALEQISALSVRYGARSYVVYRARDDRYKFLAILEFDSKLDWERYWQGPDLIAFRINCSGWYQVPVIYAWHDTVCAGAGPESFDQPAGSATLAEDD